MLSHQKLHVYELAVKWLAQSHEVVKCIPKGNAAIVNQLRRAALSVPLNIAEGAGRVGKSDKKRYYSIARGSALECAAILDALEILQLIQSKRLLNSRDCLHEIVSILSKLCLK